MYISDTITDDRLSRALQVYCREQGIKSASLICKNLLPHGKEVRSVKDKLLDRLARENGKTMLSDLHGCISRIKIYAQAARQYLRDRLKRF